MSAPLTPDDKEFLLSIVDQPNSDYDDGIEGWPNYSIAGDVLEITFLDGTEDSGARDQLTGRWQLTFLDGEVEAGR